MLSLRKQIVMVPVREGWARKIVENSLVRGRG